MGNGESLGYNPEMPLTPTGYAPLTESSGMPSQQFRPKAVFKKSLIKSAFCGEWSLHKLFSDCPIPRRSHFTVHDKETNRMYVGYGLSPQGEYLRDVWCLDLDKYVWSEIPLCGEVDAITPRSSCSACLSYTPNGTFIIIFGGFANNVYYNQLHAINISTGSVMTIATEGDIPSPRVSCLTTIYDGKYYVWGGYDGKEAQKDLYVLDLSNRTWSVFEQDVVGRNDCPWVVIGSKVFSYGSSRQGGMLMIDLDNMRVYVDETKGVKVEGTTKAGMCVVGKYIFFFGGKSKESTRYGLMFAYDTEKKWWFLFHVEPDGCTVSTQDGRVSNEGLFELPRVSGFSFVYNEKERTIVGVLGEPTNDSSELSTISVGKALGFLNIREDMVTILHNFINI